MLYMRFTSKMKKRQLIFVAMLMALTPAVSACGIKTVEPDVEIEEVEEIDEDIPTDEEIVALASGETGSEEVEALSEDDAYSLVMEQLPAGYDAIMDGAVSNDDGSYLIYTVNDDKGNPLSQQIAVNDVSGELFVYDDLNAKYLPFSDFNLYDASKDSSIDWNGQYINGDYIIAIESTDPGSFEYSVVKGFGDKYTGFAYYEDYQNAKSESEEYGNILLSLKDDELSIKSDGDCPFVGTYKLK